MDAKEVLSVLVMMVTCCAAVGPTPCCVNDQFTINDMFVQGYAPLPPKKVRAYYIRNDYAFDYTNMRLGAEETIQTQMGSTSLVKIIQDYKMKTAWTIVGTKCTKSELTDTLKKCIEGQTRFAGTRVLGDNQLEVDDWFFNVYKDGEVVGNGTISFTNTCIPVDQLLLFRNSKGGFLQGHQLTNYKRGIANPARWFTVPSFCSGAEDSGTGMDQDEDQLAQGHMTFDHVMPLPFLIQGGDSHYGRNGD